MGSAYQHCRAILTSEKRDELLAFQTRRKRRPRPLKPSTADAPQGIHVCQIVMNCQDIRNAALMIGETNLKARQGLGQSCSNAADMVGVEEDCFDTLQQRKVIHFFDL